MRKLVLIAAVTALSACNQNNAEPAAATSDSATPAPAATTASMAGTYEFTNEGKPTTTILKEDGTYEDSQDGKVVESGKWAEKDGKVCFDDTGPNAEVCWTTTEPDSMGMFTATSADGKTVLQIKKTA
jgi:hypothetical protein